MSTLYLVCTPIGNLKDITFRSAEVLWQVEVVLCEDTRKTGRLLKKYSEFGRGTKPKLLSYTDYHRHRRIPEVIKMLKQGKDVALVSNAGAPLISDPGYKLVEEVINLQKEYPSVKVVSLPGPSAVITALQLSGLPPDKFSFLGFVPKKKNQRRKFLTGLPSTTVVVFDSPHRLVDTLRDLRETRGDVKMAVCREMSKLHQEVFRGSVSEGIEHFEEEEVKGEVTLVLRVGDEKE